jgi:protein-disulfide isomerase
VLAAAVGLGPACIGKRRPQPKDEQQAAADPEGARAGLVQPDDVDDKLSEVVTGERTQVLYDEHDAFKGASAPLVTIVEYSDFECPFCSRLATSLEEIASEYPEDVRLVFKHYPLPNHANAEPAARAAVAALEQDKFWPVHDLMFANQKALDANNLEAYAKRAGLDVEKWKQRMAADDVQKQVNDDAAGGKALEVRSTPTFFVNGKKVEGAQPIEQIKALVEEERKLALALLEAGSKREEIYARIMKAAAPGEGAAPAEPQPKDPRDRQGEISHQTAYAVPIGEDSPRKGPADALVTIIEFGSMTAEASQKHRPVLAAVANEHPEVQWVYRHLPLDDAKAGRAARVAIAAHRQGKFWEMREALITGGAELETATLADLAKKVGLDEAKFNADLKDSSLAEVIAADAEVANVVRGSAQAPIYFVNGRVLTDDPTVADFEKLIDEERKKAEQWMLSQGVKKSPELYARMAQHWRGHTRFQAAGGG